MKFKHQWVYDNNDQIQEILNNGDYELTCLVVDTALENLKTKRKSIPIVSMYSQEEDIILDLILDREDIEETLNINLKLMEEFEDYERCQKIVEGIKFFQSKKSKKK